MGLFDVIKDIGSGVSEGLAATVSDSLISLSAASTEAATGTAKVLGAGAAFTAAAGQTALGFVAQVGDAIDEQTLQSGALEGVSSNLYASAEGDFRTGVDLVADGAVDLTQAALYSGTASLGINPVGGTINAATFFINDRDNTETLGSALREDIYNLDQNQNPVQRGDYDIFAPEEPGSMLDTQFSNGEGIFGGADRVEGVIDSYGDFVEQYTRPSSTRRPSGSPSPVDTSNVIPNPTAFDGIGVNFDNIAGSPESNAAIAAAAGSSMSRFLLDQLNESIVTQDLVSWYARANRNIQSDIAEVRNNMLLVPQALREAYASAGEQWVLLGQVINGADGIDMNTRMSMVADPWSVLSALSNAIRQARRAIADAKRNDD